MAWSAGQMGHEMMETGARALSWLRNVALGLFVAAILAGIFLPIYSDEIGWRFQERAGFDGVDKMFSELCGPNTVVRPPFWMMPARYYSALFHSLFPEPLYVRISGILYALALTGMTLALVWRAADSARERRSLATLAIGFLSLGTMPLLLVMSRPEQPILLAFTGALLIALAGRERDADTSAGTAWRRSLAILALALVAMSYHVKGVATAPIFLVCLALASRGRGTVLPRLIAATALVAAGAVAAQHWIHRFECTSDAVVQASFTRSTGASIMFANDWSQIGSLLVEALGNVSLFLYPGTAAPRHNPMAYWLPANQISLAQSFAWFQAIVGVWTLALIAAAWCFLRAASRAWRERKLDSRLVLAGTLVMIALGWSAAKFTGVYEATFVVPMLAFAVVLALSTHDAGAKFSGAVSLGAAAIGLIGMASIVLMAAIYGPSLVASTRAPGYVPGQPYSITPIGYSGVRRDILAAARKCGITDPAGVRKLVVDDLTYFPFMHSRLPQHRGGLFPPAAIASDPMVYLRSIKSDGIVAMCRGLPPELQARAKREGQVCCLSPADL